MVTILPPNRQKSFSERLGAGLGQAGQAAGQLIPQYMQQQEQLAREKQGLQQFSKLTGMDIQGLSPELQKAFGTEILKQQGKDKRQGQTQSFLDQLFKGGGAQQNEFDQEMGMGEGSENQGQFNPVDLTDAQIAQVTALDPNVGRSLQHAKDVGLREKREREVFDYNKKKQEESIRTDKEKEYFKLNEPKIMELAESERKLKQEEARYGRLGELFSNPEKFPSTLTAALFTRDGQINDLAYSQLTPEAQEAIKLIVDSTSNIKDTYGSRVTNFDIQTYLKKLPGLLNSPEGKKRVLRDLQTINELNQLHASGIQEIFDEAGGTDKIPYSQAERIYQKKYGPTEKEILNNFIVPEKAMFKSFPDANKFLGKKVEDTKTGEIYISDGIEWKPFKG